MDEKESEEIIVERKQKSGYKAKTIKITIDLRLDYYALLEVFANQFQISVPHALELILNRVFPRDIVKIQTLIYALTDKNIAFADILHYLKIGERNANKIIWLHNQLSEKNRQKLER